MSHSDGSWERVVADVVIAGQPRVVYNLAQHTKGMADAIPEHAQKLATLVNDLCGRKVGWHGRSAKEFQDVVADLAHEIGALSDDLTVIAGQLDGAAAKLSEAIAHIPVPLTKTTSWGWDVDHELPNHTPMDDSLHNPDNFKNALVADYAKDPSNYRDFLKLVTDPVTGRTATSHDANYQGVPDIELPKNSPNYDLYSHQAAERANRLAHWYSHNASIALHWQTELSNDYTARRRALLPSIEPRTSNGAEAPPNSEHPQNGLTDSEFSGSVQEMSGDRGQAPDGYYGQVGHPHQSKLIDDHPTRSSSDTPGIAYPDALSHLAGITGIDPNNTNSVGRASVADPTPMGLIGAGSSVSGPDRSPMPPTTSPQHALLGQSAGGGGHPTSPSGPMGMMPGAGGAPQKREERRTWLTEDFDYWSVPLGPPSVIE